MRRRLRTHNSPSCERGATKAKIQFARKLRADATPAERVVWNLLRNRNLGGWRFRRQHVIAGFIADFYCPELKLVVELDGGIHETQRDEDAKRDAALSRLGCV